MKKILFYFIVNFSLIISCHAASCSDYDKASCSANDWCSWSNSAKSCEGNIKPSNSPYIEDVMINEINVDQGYIELFFNENTDVSGWKLKINYRSGGQGTSFVECPAFPSGSTYAKDTFFITYNSNNGTLETYGSPKFDCNTVDFHQNQNEVILYDDQDRLVHYVSAWNGGSGDKLWPYEDGDVGATIMDDYISGNYGNVCSLPDGDIGEPEWDVDSGCSGSPGFTNNAILVDDDKNECPTATFDNIQDAIDASSDGQEIVICSGTYNENITINKKNLTLISQTQNRSDVTISGSSSNSVVTITNWPESITLKDLSIVQNNTNQYGIYISSQNPSNFTKFENISITSQNYDAIHFGGQSQNVALVDSYIKTTTDGDGVDFSSSNGGGFDLNNTIIDAADNGIEMSGSFNNGVNIIDSNISSLQGRAIDISGNVWNAGLSVNSSTINGIRGIYVSDAISGGLNINNTNITTIGTNSGDNSIYIAGQIGNGTTISNTTINSARYGAYFGGSLNEMVNLNNLTVNSTNTAFHFDKDINSGISITSSSFDSTTNKGISFKENVWNGCEIDDINISSKERGIEFLKNVSETFTINNVTITSEDEGLFFNDRATSPVITNADITSKNENGIYTESDNWTNFTLKDSCVKTEANNRYALYLDISSLNSSSDISNNCFYATAVSELASAKASQSGEKFNSNYWDGNSGDYTQNNISDTSTLSTCPNSCAQSSTLIPILDYRMDECEWDGSSGDVEDNSSNNYNATSQSGTSTIDEHKIGRSGYFDGTNNAYITDDDAENYINGLDEISVSVWVKSDSISNDNGVFSGNSANNSDADFGLRYDKAGASSGGTNLIKASLRTTSGNTQIETVGNIQSTDWQHIVYTWKSGDSIKIYLNGSLLNNTHDSGAVTGTITGVDFLHIGHGSKGGNWEGNIDEFKIFDKAISASQVQEIYDNENSGKNYDGTTREENQCIVSIEECFIEDFDNRSTLGNLWEIIKEENFTPKIESNKLVLTNSTRNIAAGVTLDGKFPSSDNYIEIYFKHIADGGSGADGMTIALSDASVVPVAGAYGGSLGYAQKTNIPGFAGGWLGFGFDEYGNFSNPTEGRVGGTNRVIDSVSIRGNEASGYNFIAGTNTLSPQVDNNSPDGHMYKISIDTRNSATKVKVQRDTTGSGSSYETIINWHDADQGSSPAEYKLSLTGSTGGSTNNHYVDDLVIKASNCGSIGEEDDVVDINYSFDAWDHLADKDNRYISTKIAGKEFDLSIAEVNTTSYNDDFNGTVCSVVYDVNTNQKVSDWSTSVWTNGDSSSINTPVKFTVNSAIREAKVYSYWIKDVKSGVSCNGLFGHDANESSSTDSFAIRPKEFTISSTASSKAGEAFSFDVSAADEVGNNTTDYNTSVNGISVGLNDSSKVCSTNDLDFNISTLVFENGSSSNSAKFDDVGVVDINITDTSWSAVDSSDTPQNCEGNATHPIGAYVCSPNQTITVVPDHFKVDLTVANFNSDSFTYLSNDLNMSATLDIDITAENEQNVTTQNYSTTCYAKDHTVKFEYENIGNSLENLKYILNDANDLNSSVMSTALDDAVSFFLADGNFTTDNNGSTSIKLYANFDRNYSAPVSPFDLNITELNTTDADNVSGSTQADSKATFYFGRLSVKDIMTTDEIIDHYAEIEVYDPDGTHMSGSVQNSLNWWRNDKHDNNELGKIDSMTSQPSGINFTINDALDAKVPFNIDNSAPSLSSATIHIDMDEWLWYMPSGLGYGYDSSISSGCLYHPCFDYSFSSSSANIVKSGDFNGSNFDVEDRGVYEKTGVKVYR